MQPQLLFPKRGIIGICTSAAVAMKLFSLANRGGPLHLYLLLLHIVPAVRED